MPATRRSCTAPRHRLRRCGDCRIGEHAIELRTWRTDFLLLVRRQCTCTACDCTFGRVRVEEPRFDQRHHEQRHHEQRKRTEPDVH